MIGRYEVAARSGRHGLRVAILVDRVFRDAVSWNGMRYICVNIDLNDLDSPHHSKIWWHLYESQIGNKISTKIDILKFNDKISVISWKNRTGQPQSKLYEINKSIFIQLNLDYSLSA